MQIPKNLKFCNNLLVVMLFLFSPTKSDLTILMKSGDGGGGIRMRMLVVIEQQCFSCDRSGGQGHICHADTKQWQGESDGPTLL